MKMELREYFSKHSNTLQRSRSAVLYQHVHILAFLKVLPWKNNDLVLSISALKEFR
jgi:hypothetical protein